MFDDSSDNLSRRGFFQRLRQGIPDVGPFASSESSPEDRARAALEEFGVTAMELSQRDNLLQIQCKRVEDHFGDAEMELLEPLTDRITWLDLGNTQVTDEGVQLVAEMSKLSRLYLQNTSVGDEGLAAVADLKELEYLNMYGTNVTDEGLKHLIGCEALETLYLWQTEVTKEGIAPIREKFPGLDITFGKSYFDGSAESAKFD
jgi:hypothetical protein